MQLTELSKNETLEIIGGKGKGAGSLWGMLGGSAFTHTDQIGKGFKEGSKEDVLGKITPKS